jgi:hypothetical protein
MLARKNWQERSRDTASDQRPDMHLVSLRFVAATSTFAVAAFAQGPAALLADVESAAPDNPADRRHRISQPGSCESPPRRRCGPAGSRPISRSASSSTRLANPNSHWRQLPRAGS